MEVFKALDDILDKYFGYKYSLEGLVVGAGMDKEMIAHLIDVSDIFSFEPNEDVSWEYLKLYSLLNKHSEHARITVVDINPEVCDCVRNQNFVLVSDFFPSHRAYMDEFLNGIKHEFVDERTIEEINKRLSKKTRNRITKLAIVDTDMDLEVVNCDFLEFNTKRLYDVVSIFETIRYMSNKWRVPDKLREVVSANGFVAVGDSDTSSLLPLKSSRCFKALYSNRKYSTDLDETRPFEELILQRVE